jgi:hypothetical protein
MTACRSASATPGSTTPSPTPSNKSHPVSRLPRPPQTTARAAQPERGPAPKMTNPPAATTPAATLWAVAQLHASHATAPLPGTRLSPCHQGTHLRHVLRQIPAFVGCVGNSVAAGQAWWRATPRNAAAPNPKRLCSVFAAHVVCAGCGATPEFGATCARWRCRQATARSAHLALPE